MQKYHIITFGCQMNKSDSERIAAVLEKMGYQSASEIAEADLVVVNMCSVRQKAVDRIWGLTPKFKELRNKNEDLKTVLTGCILKKDRKKFKKHFDLILDIKDLPNWPKHLSQLSDGRHKHMTSCQSYLDIQSKHQNNFSAFVPISNGCNNFCSYCVVPYTRGPLTCRPHEKILKEIRNLINGAREIWLLGQNVNDYRSKSSLKNQKSKIIKFPTLLKMINSISGDFWIRFTSSHPKYFSEDLIEVIADCKKVTPYINLPVQSGDNEILKRMNRPYTVEQYKNLVKRIRKGIPNICLSTDVIVGFPGETKEQFKNAAKLFKQVKFDMAYIAEYSPRPGTAAFKMEDNVSKKEKQRRRKVLTEILKKTALENNKKYIGKEIKVLPSDFKDGFLIGKTKTYKTCKFKGSENLIGRFAKVKITDATPWGLKAKI